MNDRAYDYPLTFAIEFLMKHCKDVSEENLCKILTVTGHALYAEKNIKKIALIGKLFAHEVIREIYKEWVLFRWK